MINKISKRVVIISLVLFYSCLTSAQSVCIDSILVNGSIKKYMKFNDLKNTGIKIDSITTSLPMDKLDPDSMIYIGSSVFWYDSRTGSCDARSILFDKITTLQLGKYTVSKSTSFEDLKKMYPINCESTQPIKIYKQEGIFQRCSIPIRDRKGQLWDMQIIFFLKNNKLFRVDFWEPV